MLLIDELKGRGILKQVSNVNKFLDMPKNAGIYVGFDPTAESLHLGNYIQIVNLLRIKQHGYRGIAVLGGATGMIGDPSFKDSERQLLDSKTITNNKRKIEKQLKKFGLEVIDNYDFYKNMSLLDFLRDVGKLINVSYMLAKDSVKSRIEKGLSFTEFSYQLIQGWDFYQLYKNHNIFGQFGASDQWGNIVTGLEIISKKVGDDHKAFAFTSDLLTDENGNKFGKSTGGGNLWLDKEMNSPYNLYQFLLNQPDSQIEKLLKWLTFLSVSEINSIMKEHLNMPSLKKAQLTLAYEVVKDIHGKKDSEKSRLISEILFNKEFDILKLKITDITMIKDFLKIIQIKRNQNLVSSLIESKVLKSKREAREFIEKKSLKINNINVDETTLVVSEHFEKKYCFLHKGKKQIILIEIID